MSHVWQSLTKTSDRSKTTVFDIRFDKKRRCFYPHSHHWQVSGIDDSPFSTPLLTSIYRRKVGQIICMDDENCLRNLATLHRWAVFKILLIFHYPAWLVGILRMACQGSLILFRKQPTRVLKTAHIVLVFIPINRYIDFSVFKKKRAQSTCDRVQLNASHFLRICNTAGNNHHWM